VLASSVRQSGQHPQWRSVAFHVAAIAKFWTSPC